MTGTCDCCERENVPLGHGYVTGIETYYCYLCAGESDPDPYGELEDVPQTLSQVAADIGRRARENREARDYAALRRMTDDEFDDARAREETSQDIVGNKFA